MNLDDAVKALRTCAKAFPVGSYVWRRADGVRGVVEGYRICGDGLALPSVTWGATSDSVFPFEISDKPVPQDDDEWRLAGSGDDGDK